MEITNSEEMLFRGLKAFKVSDGKAAIIFSILTGEEKREKMMEYMVSHTKATEDELLEQARMIAE